MPRGTIGPMTTQQPHRTRAREIVRPTGGAGRALRYVAECDCGWSGGWFHYRSEAAAAAREHRLVAALADRQPVTPTLR